MATKPRQLRKMGSAIIGWSLLVASASPASAQGGSPLVGVWGVSATPRNCTTNDPLGPPVRALMTFHQDGTSFASEALLLFAPGQRSIGHGTWAPSGGLTYTERTVVMIQFETPPNTPPGSPGFPAGWAISTHTIIMTGTDQFTSTGGTQFYNLDRQTYRPGVCATRVGERFR